MIKSGIDQDALVKLFAQATAKQGETLRKTVTEAASSSTGWTRRTSL